MKKLLLTSCTYSLKGESVLMTTNHLVAVKSHKEADLNDDLVKATEATRSHYEKCYPNTDINSIIAYETINATKDCDCIPKPDLRCKED